MAAPDPWEVLRFSTSELSTHAVQALLSAFETNPLMTRTQLAHLVRALHAEYGRAASAATADTITATRGQAGRLDLPAPRALDVIGLAQSSGIAGYALAGSDPARRAAVSVDRLVRGAQRQTVYEATARAGTAFARVPRPGACAFCLMLASRGAVYTKDTVLRTTTRARSRAGQSYHDHCHCQAQEVLSADDVPPIVAGLHEQWKRLSAESSTGVATLDQWRAHVHASRVEEAAARKAAQRESIVVRGPQKVGRAERRRGGPDEQEWARRQAALVSDTSGEDLYPHEIEFLETFEGLGERATWIPRAPHDPIRGRRPTNDFVWLTNGGVPAELKACSDNYGKIRALISRAVRKAREQDVVKDTFVIDITPYRLSPKLRAQLERYNVRNPDNTITSLWVMSGGQMHEISLLRA